MIEISLTEARARLEELVDEIEAGGSIAITRCGRAVARLTGVTLLRKPIDAAELRALTDTMRESPPEFVRSMRDSDRY